MSDYEYGRIHRLAESLEQSGISPEAAAEIMKGGEAIRKDDRPEKKAVWFDGAMQRMDALLGPETCHAVRERCACCLGGKRLQISKCIARDHETLEERIQAANKAQYVFGHSVTRQEDGRIRVAFSPEGEELYRCVCMPKAPEPLPISYCYCCGGHVKHHLQTALGRSLKLEVRSSALSSGGKQPCTFLFDLDD